MNNITPIIGISVGDINGVGLEVLIKTFQDQRMYNLCTPVLYANNMYFIKYIEKMNLVKIKFHSIKTISNIKKGCLNIINVWDEKININYGIFEKTYSKYSISSLKEVLKDATNKNIDGIVTLPINKNVFEKKEIVGHTEYISNIFKTSPLMIMCNENLKIAVATTHIPLKEVSKKISVNLLKEKITILYKSLLNDFKIEAPKIAILGLNPHAGDDGKIGREEKNIIKPFVDKIKNKILCFGPYSADSFFSNS